MFTAPHRLYHPTAPTATRTAAPGLVVYDPPMFSHRTRLLYTMGLALPIDIVKRFHPLIGISLRKPCVWADREEARGYLASRALFQQFHPEIFEAMLEHGLCQPGSEQVGTDRPV